MKNVKTLVSEINKLMGLKKDALVSGDMEALENRLSLFIDAKTDHKDSFDNKELKKIDTRIKWLDDAINVLDMIQQDILGDDFEETENIESVASKKTKSRGKKTPASDKKDSNKDTKKEEPKSEKPVMKNKEEKKPSTAVTTVPNIVPTKAYYVTLETDETLQVIYKDDKTTVLQDNEGIIECDTKKFNKGLVFYYIGKKSYAFDISSMFMA